MQDSESSILYNALTLYLQDTEDRMDYRTRYGLQVGALQDRRTTAVEMRDEARSRAIRTRIARQDRVLQNDST